MDLCAAHLYACITFEDEFPEVFGNLHSRAESFFIFLPNEFDDRGIVATVAGDASPKLRDQC